MFLGFAATVMGSIIISLSLLLDWLPMKTSISSSNKNWHLYIQLIHLTIFWSQNHFVKARVHLQQTHDWLQTLFHRHVFTLIWNRGFLLLWFFLKKKTLPSEYLCHLDLLILCDKRGIWLHSYGSAYKQL